LLVVFGASADPSEADLEYITKFHERFPKVDSPPTLAEYASAARFDERFLGPPLDKALERVNNNQGNIAWGLAYWMIAYNEMFRATGDPKYLAANLRCIDAVLAARDDKHGTKLWTGEIAPAWSSDKYAKRGRAVFGVHTGMICYPILDCLALLSTHPDSVSLPPDNRDTILKETFEALAWHDKQWRDGPGEDEGHYIMMDQEDGLDGRVKPGNRLSALGRALWTAWKVTGDEKCKDRVLRMGRYIKHRLTVGTDGAYYWEYWLPESPVTTPADRTSIKGEDTSHAQLTLSFPLMLAADGQVFDDDDVRKFGMTFTNGVARLGDGILMGSITGDPKYQPSLAQSPDGWVVPAWRTPAARELLVSFYLNYLQTPAPLALATLIRMTAEDKRAQH
jgi:hypothetical protein